MTLLLLSALAHAACPDRAALVTELENATFEGRLEDANTALTTLETAFSCGAVADPAQLAHIWLMEAMLREAEGDASSRDLALRAAHGASPSTWITDLGPDLKAKYDAANQTAPGRGMLDLSAPEDAVQYLNGAPTPGRPLRATAGLQLLQITQGNQVTYGAMLIAPAGDILQVETGLKPLAPAAGAAPAQPGPVQTPSMLPRKKSPAWLVVAGAAAVGAGVTAGLAISQTPEFADAETVAELDKVYGRQRAFGITSYSLMGVTAAAATIHFVL